METKENLLADDAEDAEFKVTSQHLLFDTDGGQVIFSQSPAE